MEAICKADFDRRMKAHNDAVNELEKAKKEKKPTTEIIIPEIVFHDIYGVWFFGQWQELIRQIGTERFGVELDKMMHVFVDVEPKKITDGIHDILVYGHQCRLHKWIAQGYHRGLVVLVDDEIGNRDAEIYRRSGTWSWVLTTDATDVKGEIL